MTKTAPSQMVLKHLLIDSAVVIGNIFLSHGLFFACFLLIVAFGRLENPFEYYQQLLLIAFCAVQIAVNIVLYKTMLKRHFKPAERKITALYFLLPVIGCALWISSFILYIEMGFASYLESYLEILVFFLPVILFTLITLAVIYRLFFRKYIGEAYCVYLLSTLGIAIIPITICVQLAYTG